MAYNPTNFWKELKRRKVIRVIIVYVAAGFAIIEFVDIVSEPLSLPDWTLAFFIVLVSVGFPVAIIFSWIFDVSPKGIVRTKAVNGGAIYKRTITRIDNLHPYERSIAVLPFQDMSLKKDQEYFCDGISEEIINALAQVNGLKVIARTSAFSFKNQNLDIREIGNKLNVETLVEGSVRKSGNRIRVAAQLIKVDDGTHIWSDKYDREIEDVFCIQDEISLAIVDNLKVKLLGNEREAIIMRHTENLEAYNFYLKGNYYNQMLTPRGLQEAIKYYEQSLQIDPQYSLANIGLASVYWYGSYWGDMRPNEAYPKVIDYVNRAQQNNNSIAEVNCLLGIINMNYYWNWEKSEEEFKKALLLNPNSSLIHIYYSLLLTSRERHKEAIAEARKAQELDPLSSYINSLAANACNFATKYENAIDICKMTLDFNPNYFFTHFNMGFAYLGLEMIKPALTEYENSVELSGGGPILVAALIGAYYANGDHSKAEECYSNLKERSRDEYIPPMCFYMIHRIRGETDLAFECLEKALSGHDSWIIWFKVHPRDEIRIPSDTRFSGLLRKAGYED